MDLRIEGSNRSRAVRVGDRVREQQRHAQDRIVRTLGAGYVLTEGVASGRRTEIAPANLAKRYKIIERTDA